MSEEARKAEAAGETTATLEFRGQTFTVPRNYDDFSVDLMESIEEGKSVGIVRGALGAAQWQQVRRMDLTMRELAELGDLVAKAMGFGSAGESSASSD